MKIVTDSPTVMELTGRRTADEKGLPGVVPYLAGGGAALLYGVANLVVLGATGPEVQGAVGVGLLMAGFGLFRAAKRQSLTLDREARTLRHRTRLWPMPWKTAIEASFDEIRSVRVEGRRENTASRFDNESNSTTVVYARVMLDKRRSIELLRTRDEGQAAELVDKVAEFVGASVAGNLSED